VLEFICIIVILSFAKAYNYLGKFAVKLWIQTQSQFSIRLLRNFRREFLWRKFAVSGL